MDVTFLITAVLLTWRPIWCEVDKNTDPCTAFDSKQLTVKLGVNEEYPCGETVPFDVAASPTIPQVSFKGARKNVTYLLAMVDPDAPSMKKAVPKKYWVHWIVANIQNKELATAGTQVLAYMPPSPPPGTGLHRYQLYLYIQKPGITAASVQNRAGFNLNLYTSDNNLKGPVAGYQFKTKSE